MIDLGYILEVYEARFRKAEREGDHRTARFYRLLSNKLLKTQEEANGSDS